MLQSGTVSLRGECPLKPGVDVTYHKIHNNKVLANLEILQSGTGSLLGEIFTEARGWVYGCYALVRSKTIKCAINS